MTEINQKKILIAEDEKAYSRALSLKLQNSGFQAEVAGDGEEAIEKIKHGNYDLLLCDLIMPKMNGFQVLEEISRQGLKIPVISISNLNQVDDEKKIRSLGAIDFISKSNTPIIEVIGKVQNYFNFFHKTT